MHNFAGRLRSATAAIVRPLPVHDRPELKRVLFAANLRRMRSAAWVLLVATPLITVIDVVAFQKLEPPASPEMWWELLGIRAVLLLGVLAFLLGSRAPSDPREITRTDLVWETGFVAFCLIYAALVAGLGLQTRPSIGAYLLGVFAVSAFIHLDGWKAMLAYVPAWLVFTQLLWRLQVDLLRLPDLVNSTLMTVLALVLSQVSYRERMRDLSNSRVIERQRMELEIANRQLSESNAMLRKLSYLDALTDVPNRRWFDEFLTREWTRAIRERTSIALIMADLDHFKRLNDERGHQAGDSCLIQVAAALRQAILRPADFLARYGGEEFALVLPETDMEGARLVAERLQRAVDSLLINLPDGSTARITVSLGVASLRPVRNHLPDELVAGADQALYQAKAGGRAQYVCTS